MNSKLILTEIKLKGIRSSGPGGQNVNKVATKVELIFDLNASNALSASEKSRLETSIKHRLTKEKILLLQCDESRSQFKNKSIIIKRFFEILLEGLKKAKVRKASKPTRASIAKRLNNKKNHSQKKANRRKPDY